jgi:hypothetical protein
LLDAMRGDFVQQGGAERPVRRFQDVAIAVDASLIELGVIGEVGIRKLLERDVGLPADALSVVLR